MVSVFLPQQQMNGRTLWLSGVTVMTCLSGSHSVSLQPFNPLQPLNRSPRVSWSKCSRHTESWISLPVAAAYTNCQCVTWTSHVASATLLSKTPVNSIKVGPCDGTFADPWRALCCISVMLLKIKIWISLSAAACIHYAAVGSWKHKNQHNHR